MSRQCRICFGTEDHDALMRTCPCNALMHKFCLEKWLRITEKKWCEVCLYEYTDPTDITPYVDFASTNKKKKAKKKKAPPAAPTTNYVNFSYENEYDSSNTVACIDVSKLQMMKMNFVKNKPYINVEIVFTLENGTFSVEFYSYKKAESIFKDIQARIRNMTLY